MSPTDHETRVLHDAIYQTENYVSPYGFGTAIDALLDVVAKRHDLLADDLADILHKNRPSDRTEGDGVYDWIDLYFWDQYAGPAVDALDERIFPQDES